LHEEWLRKYRKNKKKEDISRRHKIREKMLSDLKKQHMNEKLDEVDRLEKRLAILKSELESYSELQNFKEYKWRPKR
jgi:hypothetical protein